MIKRFLTIFIVWLILPIAPAAIAMEKSSLNLTSGEIEALQQIGCGWKTTDRLLAEDFILDTEASKIKADYVKKVRSIIPDLENSQVDLEKIVQYQNNASSFSKRLGGLLSLSNIILTISSFLFAIAIGSLITIYLLPLLFLIPLTVYELALYIVIFTAISAGYWLEAQNASQYIVLSGCLSLIGMIAFSSRLHKPSWQKFGQKIGWDIFSFSTFILFFIWSAVAIIYQNTAIAFLAILALEAFCGFAVAVTPLTYTIGFRSRAVIPKAMLLSLLLSIAFITVRVTNSTLSYLDVFSLAVNYIGSFVYFIGLLIVSSKWYFRNNFKLYLFTQGLTVVSGIAALYISSIWQISALKGISGTLFTLYAIEKYIELPWTKKTVAWAMFGLAIILYGSTWLIRSYPELFLIG